jgi:Fe-S oxidoreductase
MGTAYDPHASDYVDEMAVRHETARVFDVCMSCQQCVDTCSVFSLMVTDVEGCVDRDAALLTPTQQDDIINACTQCTQCTTQCPYIDQPLGQAVNFPALVIRHRAMLRRNKFLTVRQEVAEKILTHSATHMSWGIPFRFLGAQLLRYVTGSTPAVLSRRRDVAKGSTSHGVQLANVSEVTFFPTCVIDAYAPEVDASAHKVFARAGVHCVSGKGHSCCGAPDLYAGNIRRFRRVVTKNVRAFRASLEQGRGVVVGQPGCLHVMREHYADFSNDPGVADVVTRLQDPWEFLAEIVTSEQEKDFHPHIPQRNVVLLQSSITERHDEATSAHELLKRWGWDVQVLPQVYIAETMWELRKDRMSLSADLVPHLDALSDGVGDAQIVGESCLTNLLLAEQGHRRVRHPLEVLADQI